jgi:tetraacyldisaccharide 4'-kinase
LRVIERIWRGDDAFSRAARVALLPIEVVYRVATAARGWMYERSLLHVHHSSIPVVSVGNLSVGGTGKTPFTAWLASELARRGAHPAVVLRGYGGDEPLVHARLNREIPVIIEPRRARGVARAAEIGATVAVLDDAFQHRAAKREIDIALLAAEQWGGRLHLLPAGPWREPLSALNRASLVVITRKDADSSRVTEMRAAISRVAPGVPQAVVRFTLSELRGATAGNNQQTLPLSVLQNRPVVAIAGIADPDAFFHQLTEAGATVTPFGFPDHHRYSVLDVERVLTTVRAGDAMVVCTLKDAVKLASIWPATARALWYVLQALEIESGGEALAEMISQLAPKDRP